MRQIVPINKPRNMSSSSGPFFEPKEKGAQGTLSAYGHRCEEMLNEGMGASGGENRVPFRSPAAFLRVRRGVEFLLAHGSRAEVVIVGASGDSAAQLARTASAESGGSFGWYRFTLTRLALALEAICARIVHRLGTGGLGRFAVIADRPGLPRALARTLDELRMGGVVQ